MRLLHAPFAMLAVLFAVTLCSYAVFETHGAPLVVGVGVVGFASLKVAIIMRCFMEVRLRQTPVGPALAIWLIAASSILGAGLAFR